MNKKLYGSLAVIAVLLAYIFFSNQKGTRDVPELEQWEGEITELTLKSGEKLLKFQRSEGKWLMGDEKYPADGQTVKNLIEKVKDLRITDLVSRQKFYRNYDLQPEKASVVTLKQKDKVVRKLTVGKTGTTGQHSYLLVDNRPEIYLGAVTFKGDFNRSVEAYRDKVVMKVSKDAVSSIAVKYRGRTFSFMKEEIKEKKEEIKKTSAPELEKKSPSVPKKPEMKWVCKGYEKVSLNKSKVDGLLNSLDPLRAGSYPDIKKETLRGPLATVIVKAFNKDITVKIFRQQKDKKYPAISSESPYVFTMDEWHVKKYFIENLKDFRDNK